MKYYLILALAICTTKANVNVVPIGVHCSAAAALRRLNIREMAFPFDWMVSGFINLYNCFNEDFKHFLEKNSLRPRYDNQAIVDYYGFEFPHDFPTTQNLISKENAGDGQVAQSLIHPNFKDYADAVKSKYDRRIERLYQILNSSEKVFFIRHFGMDRNQAISFRDLILKKFPKLDFLLVVVNPVQMQEVNWNLNKIRNYYLDDRQAWNNPAEWERIYKDLGLTPNKSSRSIIEPVHKCLLCNPEN